MNTNTELPATVYDESNGLTYDLVGDYYYPRLSVPEEPEGDIGSALELTFVKGKKSSRICLRGVRLLAPPPGEDEE